MLKDLFKFFLEKTPMLKKAKLLPKKSNDNVNYCKENSYGLRYLS